MERTFFSALNMAFTLSMLGVGLMSVGANDASIPDGLGASILAGSVLFCIASYYVHWSRMRAFVRGNGIEPDASLLWTGSLFFLFVIGLSFELHYALLHPYLKRGKVVEIANFDP
jgi:hypothetical protein